MSALKFKYLDYLLALYLSTMLAVFVLSSRATLIFGVSTMGASIVYPLCILIGDIIAEVYGYSIFRRVMWVTFICALIFSMYLKIINLLPTLPEYTLDASYNAVITPILSMTTLIIIGITFGQFTDSYFLTKWKTLFKGKYFFMRCVGSTFLGAFVTTAISYTSRFYSLPFMEAIKFVGVSYLLKIVGVFIFAIPGAIVVYFLKKAEPEELRNIKTEKFNPFNIS